MRGERLFDIVSMGFKQGAGGVCCDVVRDFVFGVSSDGSFILALSCTFSSKILSNMSFKLFKIY